MQSYKVQRGMKHGERRVKRVEKVAQKAFHEKIPFISLEVHTPSKAYMRLENFEHANCELTR